MDAACTHFLSGLRRDGAYRRCIAIQTAESQAFRIPMKRRKSATAAVRSSAARGRVESRSAAAISQP